MKIKTQRKLLVLFSYNDLAKQHKLYQLLYVLIRKD